MQQSDENPEPGAVDIERFMAVAAHDVRNPVAVVRASAQMAQRSLARGDLEATQHRLKAIVEQTDRITEVLETFLDAARVGTRHMPLRLELVELQDLAGSAIERARMLVGDRGNRPLDCDIAEGLAGTWDRSRIVRALRALVANAMLYGDPAAPVRLHAERRDEHVRVLISGGGAGPSEEEASHLFERFYRGPSAAEAGQSGSGLGLYTARGIARLHGGDVRRLDGDQFEMKLPLSSQA